ncbi:MAG TPA: tetratricopeptide repeat protein, partial [Candidatus Obscuribacter sp.]|nr:tetratricopeptide repeat protein [Candidatus Obscuribacter sp.]
AIFLAPQMASAHYGMGLAMYQMKDFAGASAAFKQAIMLNPNLIDARNKLEICLKKGGSGPSMATM